MNLSASYGIKHYVQLANDKSQARWEYKFNTTNKQYDQKSSIKISRIMATDKIDLISLGHFQGYLMANYQWNNM